MAARCYSMLAAIGCVGFFGCGSDDEGGASAGSGGSAAATGEEGGVATGGAAAGTGGAATGGGNATGGNGTGGAASGGSPGTGGAGAAAGGGGAGGGPTDPPRATCDGTPVPALQLTEVASGLSSPVFMTSDPTDASRLFILEKGGRIMLKEGANAATSFLDIRSQVSSNGERGLLGMAFHPDFGSGGEDRFWIYYTQEPDTASVVAEYQVSSDPDVADTNENRLFAIPQPAGNHNGGTIAFGPDGMLYFGLGDGGGANDTYDNGQTLSTELGGMLRIDVDSYPTPPAGNMAGNNVAPDLYHYGLRNPFRFSFDRVTGDLYIGDVGQNRLEEVHVVAPDTGNHNFGWPIMEGTECFQSTTCEQAGLTLPVDEYPNPDPAAIIGGYVYRGGNIPSMIGRYFYADYSSNRFWSFKWDGTTMCDKEEITDDLGGVVDGPGSFGEDADGELYVVSLDTGQVFRFDTE